MKPKERYAKLKEHLQEENPLLVEAIEEYQKLDAIAHDLGVLHKDKTYTESISWWPLISILGTFSAGKSSFINELLEERVQETGNQAVDDKFTVICYSKRSGVTTLPGVALDADPRFPFYNISKEIEKLDSSDKNINRYLQLKTVSSPTLKGKILIDSPGFDADVQRDATLKITRHIIDLSDLVLIFFDARHPEPGAMRDTLDHLVETAINHNDSDKVLFVLNQIDTCSKEDNLEEIIGAWQRALAQKGVVSGKFYAIYNESLAQIEDSALAERLKSKKEHDLAQIFQKIDSVVVDRAYRIVKNIETHAKTILELLPQLHERTARFRNRLLVIDLVLLALFGALLFFARSTLDEQLFLAALGGSLILFLLLHYKLKSLLARVMARKITDHSLRSAFEKATKWYKNALLAPRRFQKASLISKLESLIQQSKNYIQKLNDQFIHVRQRDDTQAS